jgi:hypothetical protein
MSTPLAFIQLRAPSFAERQDINAFIEIAEGVTSSTAYGALRYQAVGLLVCHQLALNERNSNNYAVSGQITSERTGKQSRSYSGGFFAGTTQSTLDPYLSQTYWGMELINLQKSCIPAIFIKS